MITVALLQPLELYRNGLNCLLGDCPEPWIVQELCSEQEALASLRAVEPGVMIVDVADDLAGVVRRLRHQAPGLKMVVLYERMADSDMELLLHLGVRGFMTRNNPAQVLWRAVRAVASDQSFFCPESSAVLALAVNAGTRASSELTVREQLILDHTSRGLTIKEIARELSLSPRTIESLRGGITRKLGCRNVMEALQKARLQGLLGS